MTHYLRAIGDVRLQLHWEYLFVKFVIVARTATWQTSNYAGDYRDEPGVPEIQERCIVPRGHTRTDPNCVLHGCLNDDAREIQAFLRQNRIDDAVQDFLTGRGENSPALHLLSGKAPQPRTHLGNV